MDALHREQRKEREETENKIKGLVNEVKLSAIYCFVSLCTGFEQLFPWVEIRADLSFVLTLSKHPKKQGRNKRMNGRMEPNNEEKKEREDSL